MDALERVVAIYLRAYNKLEGPVAGAKRTLDKLVGHARKAGQKLGRHLKAGVEEFEQRMRRAAQVTAIAASLMTGAGFAVGVGFEQAMADVGAIANASAEGMQLLEFRARSLGATTAFSAREVAEAELVLAQAGQNVADIYNSVEGVLLLAGAGGASMGEAAELVTGTLSQFNMTSDQSVGIVNLFAAGLASSRLNMQRLSAAMPYAGVAAGAFNVPLNDTVAMLGLLHDRGLLGEMAGTGLRQTFIQLANPTGKLAKLLDGVTLSGHTAQEVLIQLREAGVQAADAYDLVGARAGGALSILLDVGPEEIDRFSASLQRLADQGAAFEQYEKRMQTVGSQMKILRSAAEELAIALFRVVQDDLQRGFAALASLINEAGPRIVHAFGQIYVWAKVAARGVFAFIKQHEQAIISVGTFAVALGATVAVWRTLTNPIFGIVAGLAAIIAAGKIAKEQFGYEPPEWMLDAWRGFQVKLKEAIFDVKALFSPDVDAEPLFDPEAILATFQRASDMINAVMVEAMGNTRTAYDELSATRRSFVDATLAGHQAMFATIMDMEMTGQQRREQIWESMKQAWAQALADMTREYVKHAAVWFFGGILKSVFNPLSLVTDSVGGGTSQLIDDFNYNMRTSGPATPRVDRRGSGPVTNQVSVHFHDPTFLDDEMQADRFVRRIEGAMYRVSRESAPMTLNPGMAS